LIVAACRKRAVACKGGQITYDLGARLHTVMTLPCNCRPVRRETHARSTLSGSPYKDSSVYPNMRHGCPCLNLSTSPRLAVIRGCYPPRCCHARKCSNSSSSSSSNCSSNTSMSTQNVSTVE